MDIAKHYINRLLSLQAEKFVGAIGLPPNKQQELDVVIAVTKQALEVYFRVGDELFQQIALCDDIAGHGIEDTDELKKAAYLAKLFGIEDTEKYYWEQMEKRHDQSKI